MLRLLLRLFGVKDFDTCKSCETYKEQLLFVREQNKELMETLLLLTKPAIAPVASAQQEIKLVNPAPGKMMFSRRKGILENMHNVANRVKETSPFIAKPDAASVSDERKNVITQDTVEEMEKKLGFGTEENVSQVS